MDTVAMIEAGMQNDVQRMQVISHNLANLSTAGFKKEVAVTRVFHDHLTGSVTDSALNAAAAARPVVTTATDYSAGALKFGGNPLDLAIEGDSYFAVEAPWGEAYTRQGSFRIDEQGRLVTAGGLPVLGTAGEIRLSGPAPRIDAQGNVYEGTALVDRLRVVQAPDTGTLSRVGGGLFASDGSGPLQEGGTYRVRQGYTEAANVVSMHEMIKMIETLRHFEASQKLARGYDDMLDRAINVLGEL